MRHSNVFLIGPMGAGKSTIGRLLSAEIGLIFKDSDREIEHRTGADIPWIFDVEGERGFRLRETAAIDELTQEENLLLATGGGAVMREENRRFLKGRGIVVYLKTSIEQQLERTSKDKGRPLLQNDNPRAILEKLFAEREPVYLEVADIVINTNERNPKSVVQEIVSSIESLTDPLSK